MYAITIGLDIAKSVFRVYGEDATGKIILQKKLRRSQVEEFFRKQPRCLIGLEACGTSHHWARTLRELGHDVRLIPPAYVKPFVKRNKNDARDRRELICTALGRPEMRIVAVKSIEQQASRGLERSRMLLVKQRTQLMKQRARPVGRVRHHRRRGPARLRATGRAARRRRGGHPLARAGGAAAADPADRRPDRGDRELGGSDHGDRARSCCDAAAHQHSRHRRADRACRGHCDRRRPAVQLARATSPPGAA